MLPQTERAPPRRRRASSATPSAAAADRGERSERGERGERAEQADAAIELGPMHRRAATAEIDLGDEARFWPCDEALGRWRSIAQGGAATIVYE